MIYMDSKRAFRYGEYKGKKCFDLFRNQNLPCHECGSIKALKTNSIVVNDMIQPHDDNRPMQVTSVPFKDQDGQWLVAKVYFDISQRIWAEEALLKSEDRFRKLVKNSSDFFEILDKDGVEIFVSGSVESIGRLPSDEGSWIECVFQYPS